MNAKNKKHLGKDLNKEFPDAILDISIKTKNTYIIPSKGFIVEVDKKNVITNIFDPTFEIEEENEY
jgi:hypothetical protein